MNYFPWSVAHVRVALKALGAPFWTKPYDVNLFGVRTNDAASNAFNDWIAAIVHRPGGHAVLRAYPGTTDPGLYWRENPMRGTGTAIVVPGHYPGLWELGQHKGYPALRQKGVVRVWRDANRNAVLDWSAPLKIEEGTDQLINLHRASEHKTSIQVDKWSAGCQVVADPDDFQDLHTICMQQVEALGVNSFSYTLFTEDQLNG